MNNKFKGLISKIKEVYGDVYRTYPITMILVNITTFVALIYCLIGDTGSNVSRSDFIFMAVRWLLWFLFDLSTGSLGIEALQKRFLEKNGLIKKVFGLIVSAFISGILATLVTRCIIGIDLNYHISVTDNRILAFNLAYFILIALSVFYSRYKDSDFTIEKYVVHVFTQIIQIGIAWGILAVGFFLLSAISEELLDSILGAFTVPQVLIIGLYVVPNFLMGITKVKEEVGRFFVILIKYIMLIMTIVGAGIIYLYIVKTIFTGIPSNEIFGITSALFFVAIPVGFTCTAFERDTVLQKIAYVLPYIYAPFIILQSYSIIIRIKEYGVTPSRYAGIVLMILEILYTLTYAFCRKHIDKLILVMMAITVIATIVPGINAVDFSKITQKRVITRFIENGMPDSTEERERLTGAYDYLKYEYGKNYISSFLSNELQEEIIAIDPDSIERGSKTYNLHTDMAIVPTEGYEYVAKFSARISSYDKDNDTSYMKLKVDKEDYGRIDLSEEYESVIQRCNDRNVSSIEGPDIIQLSDDCELYVQTVNITSQLPFDDVIEYHVTGYILMNQEYIDGLHN